jgi:hypothetical protein
VFSLGVSKKTEKPIKPRKLEKNNRKNRIVKKNQLNRLKFKKNRLVRFGFGFISKKLKKPNRTPTEKNQKKTKPNQAKIEPKPEKTEPKMRKLSQNRENQAEPEKPSQTGLNRFRFF